MTLPFRFCLVVGLNSTRDWRPRFHQLNTPRGDTEAAAKRPHLPHLSCSLPTPERDLCMMSISQDLQNLYSLNTSSPDFSHDLRRLIQDDQYLISLQGPELTRLLDFLDNVRVATSTPHRLTEQTLQALNAIPATDDVSRECLHKLQTICGHNVTLPSSYAVESDEIIKVGSAPANLDGVVDVWEGTYRGEKVSIKCLRVRTRNQRTIKKVRIRYGTCFSRQLKNPCGCRRHSSKRPLHGKG